MEAKNSQPVWLLPCSGRARLNIPRGHIYGARSESGENLGYITKQDATKKWGEGNFHISGSDTLCPFCFLNAGGEIDINIIS